MDGGVFLGDHLHITAQRQHLAGLDVGQRLRQDRVQRDHAIGRQTATHQTAGGGGHAVDVGFNHRFVRGSHRQGARCQIHFAKQGHGLAIDHVARDQAPERSAAKQRHIGDHVGNVPNKGRVVAAQLQVRGRQVLCIATKGDFPQRAAGRSRHLLHQHRQTGRTEGFEVCVLGTQNRVAQLCGRGLGHDAFGRVGFALVAELQVKLLIRLLVLQGHVIDVAHRGLSSLCRIADDLQALGQMDGAQLRTVALEGVADGIGLIGATACGDCQSVLCQGLAQGGLNQQSLIGPCGRGHALAQRGCLHGQMLGTGGGEDFGLDLADVLPHQGACQGDVKPPTGHLIGLLRDLHVAHAQPSFQQGLQLNRVAQRRVVEHQGLSIVAGQRNFQRRLCGIGHIDQGQGLHFGLGLAQAEQLDRTGLHIARSQTE